MPKSNSQITVIQQGLTSDACLPLNVYQESVPTLDLATGRYTGSAISAPSTPGTPPAQVDYSAHPSPALDPDGTGWSLEGGRILGVAADDTAVEYNTPPRTSIG